MSEISTWVELDGSYSIRGFTKDEFSSLVAVLETAKDILPSRGFIDLEDSEIQMIDMVVDEENIYSEAAQLIYEAVDGLTNRIETEFNALGVQGFDRKTILSLIKDSAGEI